MLSSERPAAAGAPSEPPAPADTAAIEIPPLASDTVAASPIPPESPPPEAAAPAAAAPEPAEALPDLSPSTPRRSVPPETRTPPQRADTPVVGTETPITGELLKRVRESKGLTLKEISDKTRIGRKNLEAVEEERFDELPDAKIYVRGFVRCLALELGLDPERAATSYLVRWDHWYEGQNFPKKRALRGRP